MSDNNPVFPRAQPPRADEDLAPIEEVIQHFPGEIDLDKIVKAQIIPFGHSGAFFFFCRRRHERRLAQQRGSNSRDYYSGAAQSSTTTWRYRPADRSDASQSIGVNDLVETGATSFTTDEGVWVASASGMPQALEMPVGLPPNSSPSSTPPPGKIPW